MVSREGMGDEERWMEDEKDKMGEGEGKVRTGKQDARVQVDVGTIAQEERDGARGRRHPAEGRGNADAHAETAVRDVERVLGAGEGGEGAGQEGDCETHLDRFVVGIVDV